MARGSRASHRPSWPRRPWIAAVVLAVVAAAAALAGAPAARAHAELLKSSPSPGVSLSRSPAEILLTFTEDVDVSLSGILVYDQRGDRVPGLKLAEAVPGTGAAMRALLSTPLPRGLYTVEWRAISADDGHASAGVFSFGVRAHPLSAKARDLNGTTTAQAAASIAGRWLLYVGLVLMVGAALTGWLALGGLVTEAGQWLLRGAWLLAATGLLVSMLAERAITRAPSLLPMFLTPEGAALANEGKALTACAAALVVLFLWPHRVALAVLSAAAAVTMLFHVFAGHADAASYRALAILAQWVHMMGVGVWVGGLAWLLLGLRGETGEQWAASVRRFSAIAGVTLGVVLVSGVARAAGEVSPSHLFTTSYGQTLLVKVALVVALVALGAVNRYRLVPALSADPRTLQPFTLNSRAELAVAAGVLAATALLSGLAPALIS